MTSPSGNICWQDENERIQYVRRKVCDEHLVIILFLIVRQHGTQFLCVLDILWNSHITFFFSVSTSHMHTYATSVNMANKPLH